MHNSRKTSGNDAIRFGDTYPHWIPRKSPSFRVIVTTFLLALNAPQQMWIGGEGNQLPEVVEKCYASTRAKRPEVFIGSEKMAAAAVSRWMSR